MTTPGIDPALAEMMDGVFAEHGRDADLWNRLDGLGLIRLTGDEESGGSGAGWNEAAELLSAAVRHGTRIPLAEHDLLACWVLESVGIDCDASVRTVCVLDENGAAASVPWASHVDRVVLVWSTGDAYSIADVSTDEVAITAGTNMIGEARDGVTADLDMLTGVEVDAATITVLRLKSTLVRSIQVCAALDRALEMTIEHATSRHQFGRPLAKFQAVQHQIADIAAEAALARSATETALTTAVSTDWSAPNLEFLVAAARSCAGHAATVVVRNAHQIHGAIGTTSEHRLHEFTRAALAWRSEYGSVRHWDAVLTDMAVQAGPHGLWSLICP
ncbi:acyl-CoA dehydrogenase family protein [Mycobacterium sp. 236(2023)]|uniref:acyl-CoA dehydrogenase family protein n=1 Tax=Mycobacterium sp. 236(2023) TaxID=3038163 RepID=UPI0024154459|nr:acyl-CoA dehydrogenase family protein [Mycobacterium sp. 236(2023)]MDG4667688.1 acyl-CoA dehydrogenase family protein [Mycobacterium sp. 236(2023)]